MSKYTTEVRFICESFDHLTESAGYSQINEIIHNVHNDVIGNYPIFDETYRETLNTKILRHYYTREICEETVGLWQLRLNVRMNEIMPYYNKLYESELIKFNPLYDVDMSSNRIRSGERNEQLSSESKEIRNESRITDAESQRNIDSENKRSDIRNTATDSEENRTNNTSSTNQNENTSNSIGSATNNNTRKQTDKYSDTPQGGVTGLESGTYLTNARIIDGTETDEQNNSQTSSSNGKTSFSEDGTLNSSINGSEIEVFEGGEKGNSEENEKNSVSEASTGDRSENKNDVKNINNTEDYLEYVRGKRGSGSYSKMLTEFRDTFLNIDRMIINDLADLFFGLWE